VCVFLPGCNRDRPSSTADGSSKQQAQDKITANSVERTTCTKHQSTGDGCGAYRVLSYDATWRNEFGNQGQFTLERDGLAIRANCGSAYCRTWANAVGKIVIANKGIGDLIIRYEPLCEQPLYVEKTVASIKQNEGRSASVAEICWDTLIVERIEAKTPK
jgi:hypothetical protein